MTASVSSVSNNDFLKPSVEGVEAFLAGSFTSGIGKVYAKKIIDKYGDKVLDPEFDIREKLSEIPGLNQTKIDDLLESFSSLKVSPSVLAFLYSAGLKDAEVEKIYSHYGKRLEKLLAWDPYDMVENVWKLSFFTADKIGKYMKINQNDPRRIRGSILTAVKLYAEEGNMFATEAQALQTASRISGVAEEEIKPLIDDLTFEGRLVKSLDGLYLPVYYNAEEEAANKIKAMVALPPERTYEETLPERDIFGNPLNDMQKKAIKTVLKNKFTIITGGPGTGKTTTVRGMIKLLMDADKKVILAAPTGRAAKRMSELTGEEAKTIHRLLGYSMGKGYKNKKFDADVLIIDEASMLEQVLFNHLLQALNENTRVVLVGDPDQLPAIGAGNVLKDMIASGEIPVVNLTENFRQKDGSLISENASAIKSGNNPDFSPAEDFVFVEEKNQKNIHDRLLSLVAEELPLYTGILPHEIQVVTPQQEGPLGAKRLNFELQQKINPDAPSLKRGLKEFRLGDRVMQTANNSIRGIYNGETGRVSQIDSEHGRLEVTFNDGKKSDYGLKELKELTLAYATTVHKLQGSETDYMVMLLSSAHRPMLYRNLLYTGISRAKKLCVLLGETKALKSAIENTDKNVRNSNFKTRLSHPRQSPS